MIDFGMRDCTRRCGSMWLAMIIWRDGTITIVQRELARGWWCPLL